MYNAQVLIRLARQLAKAYQEAAGPTPPKKGWKKLNPNDYEHYFHLLARQLRQLRLATLVDKPKFPHGIGGCPEGWVNCGGECMLKQDCTSVMKPHHHPQRKAKTRKRVFA
jgi:hypothetical protein